MLADWQALGSEFKSRLLKVLEPSRFLYFVFVVVGIGGLGAWLQFPNASLFRDNLATYAMGIAAGAAVELVLPDLATKALRMLGISLGILCVALSLLSAQSGYAWVVWLGAVCGWILWILSNSSNPNLGGASPAAATGGDPGHVAGDLAGFAT